jgi:hypothetical protein
MARVRLEGTRINNTACSISGLEKYCIKNRIKMMEIETSMPGALLIYFVRSANVLSIVVTYKTVRFNYFEPELF